MLSYGLDAVAVAPMLVLVAGAARVPSALTVPMLATRRLTVTALGVVAAVYLREYARVLSARSGG